MSRVRNKHSSLKSRAQRKGLAFDLDVDDVRDLLQVTKCALCSCLLTFDEKPNQLTIDRINHDKGYVKGNVQAACYTCNQRKSRIEDPHANPLSELKRLVRYRNRLRAKAR